MTPRPASSSTGGVHAALASPTRRRLLELLRTGRTPRDVHELGRAVTLHPSTVRFHLEILCRAGLVVRQASSQAAVGRPRTAYAAVAEGAVPEGSGPYEGLARLLAANLSETAEQRSARAEQIGERWAEQLVPGSSAAVTADEATTEVGRLFEQVGFAPEVGTGDDEHRIALHACPFRALARDHPEVVCAVHLGLFRGSLTRLGSSATPRLTPFVEPELCMAELVGAA